MHGGTSGTFIVFRNNGYEVQIKLSQKMFFCKVPIFKNIKYELNPNIFIYKKEKNNNKNFQQTYFCRPVL